MLLLKDFLLLEYNNSCRCACSNNYNCNNNNNYSYCSVVTRFLKLGNRRIRDLLALCIKDLVTNRTLIMFLVTRSIYSRLNLLNLHQIVIAKYTVVKNKLVIAALVSTLISSSTYVLAIAGSLSTCIKSMNSKCIGSSSRRLYYVAVTKSVCNIGEIKLLDVAIEALADLELKSNKVTGLVAHVILFGSEHNLNKTALVCALYVDGLSNTLFGIEQLTEGKALKLKDLVVKLCTDLKPRELAGVGINGNNVLDVVAGLNNESVLRSNSTLRLHLSGNRESGSFPLSGDSDRRKGEHHNNNQKN